MWYDILKMKKVSTHACRYFFNYNLQTFKGFRPNSLQLKTIGEKKRTTACNKIRRKSKELCQA